MRHGRGAGLFISCASGLLACAVAFTDDSGPASRLPGFRPSVSPRRAQAGPLAAELDSTIWWEQTQRALAAREYELTPATPGMGAAWLFQAPNRAQEFRARFTSLGPDLAPRDAAGPDWSAALTLARWGHPERMEDVPPARLEADGRRITYDRRLLVETHENGERGLASALRVVERAFAPGAVGEPGAVIQFDLDLEGTLSPFPVEGGVLLRNPEGDLVLTMRALAATDASGRSLPVEVTGLGGSEGRGLRLTVGVEEVTFPLALEWVTGGAIWSIEGDQSGGAMGFSVAAAGDINGDGRSDVLVGAPTYDLGQSDEGCAWLYLGQGTGLATTPAWTGEANQSGARYGASVAGAGDVNGDGYADVLVGAPLFDGKGRSWIYHGSATGLIVTAPWTVTGAVGARLGEALAAAGDVNGDGYADVVVGAPGQGSAAGRAQIFRGSPTGLAVAPAWTLDGSVSGGELGAAVGAAGDVDADGYGDFIVGIPQVASLGAARIYLGAPGQPTLGGTVTGEANGSGFGGAVSGAGDVNGDFYADVLIGSPGLTRTFTGEGGAYLYLGGPGGPSVTAAWTIAGGQAGAALGEAIAAAGDLNGDGYADIAVGAPLFAGGAAEEGRVEVYLGGSGGLQAAASWTIAGGQAGARLGSGVASAGDADGDGYADLLIGASGTSNPEAGEGRALVYYGGPGRLSEEPAWFATVTRPVSRFGFSVAGAGDVNGDGYGDVIVGVPVYDGGQVLEGKVFLYLGSPYGPSSDYAWSAESDSPLAQLGFSVASAGDVNGDGFGDIIAGEYALTNPQFREGGARVYLGSPYGPAPTAAWSVESNSDEAQMGTTVGCVGDVNGDGYDDVFVGADFLSNGDREEGKVFVYHGSPQGPLPVASWSAEGNKRKANFGFSADGAGDVNGDGYADLVVGAFLHSEGSFEGRAYVYHGSEAGLSLDADWIAAGPQPFSRFGGSVAGVGDVNGDGYSDIAVSANQYDAAFTDEGAVFVYHGSAAGLPAAPSWSTFGAQQGALLGESVAGAGDVNGDGYSDLLIGAIGFDNGELNEGAALIHLGSAAGLAAAPAWRGDSDQPGAWYGRAVASGGDINADGFADVLVGAPMFDSGQQDEGAVFLHWGSGGMGRPVLVQQRRADGSALLGQVAEVDAAEGFRIVASSATPAGRGRVKLGWEVRPLGTPFTGQLTGAGSAWADNLSTPALDVVLSGLASNTLYHWRARLLQHPNAWPPRARGRWITPPVAGWPEADVRTVNSAALPAVPGGLGSPGPLLSVIRLPDGRLELDWSATCGSGPFDYVVYEGTLGDFPSHVPLLCSTSGQTAATVSPAAGATYYLVAPRSGAYEGSHGKGSNGAERHPGPASCLPLAVRSCE